MLGPSPSGLSDMMLTSSAVPCSSIHQFLRISKNERVMQEGCPLANSFRYGKRLTLARGNTSPHYSWLIVVESDPQFAELREAFLAEEEKIQSCLSSDVFELVVAPIRRLREESAASDNLPQTFLDDKGCLNWQLFTSSALDYLKADEHSERVTCPLSISSTHLEIYSWSTGFEELLPQEPKGWMRNGSRKSS